MLGNSTSINFNPYRDKIWALIKKLKELDAIDFLNLKFICHIH